MDNTLTEANFDAFKEMYLFAVKEKQDIFSFHGQEILVGYAKYVVEYFEGQEVKR